MSNTTSTFSITTEDIEKAAELLSKNSNTISFNDDSKKVIEAMDSCFVKACPGSGKTTTLVAKLAILADKLPHSYEGICVLSHTNVAKDEVKKRIGTESDRFFKYPNFIGTIQSFVDTYLAIPAMIEKFGLRPNQIDDDIFTIKAKQNFSNLNDGAKNYFRYNEYLKLSNVRYLNSDVEKIGFKSEHDEKIEEKLTDSTKNTYKEIKKIKNLITKDEGVIAYSDAFALANWYIKKHPELSETISKRFPYVFIDEVQDTSENQLELLTTIFKGSKIQYFGDNNQNLYNPGTNVLEKIQELDSNIINEKVLPINNTYRLSPNICKLSQHVCRDRMELSAGKQYICGNKEDCKKCGSCQNTIILYEDNTIQDVLPLYAQLIQKQKELKESMGQCYKLVGHRGKEFTVENIEKGRFSLSNYYDEYKKDISSTTIKDSLLVNFTTVLSFAEKYISDNDFKEAKKILLRGILKLANFQNIKIIKTVSDIKKHFNDKNATDKLNLFLFKCCDSIKNNNLNFKEVSSSLEMLVKEIQDSELTENSKAFLKSVEIVEDATEQKQKNDNTYTDKETKIKIEISTIAGIKGETHDATLLAETYMRSNDLNKFLKLIANQSFTEKQLTKLQEDKRLNDIYVAMTRPKHLLCLAMHENSFNYEFEESLIDLGWKINRVLINGKERIHI